MNHTGGLMEFKKLNAPTLKELFVTELENMIQESGIKAENFFGLKKYIEKYL